MKNTIADMLATRWRAQPGVPAAEWLAYSGRDVTRESATWLELGQEAAALAEHIKEACGGRASAPRAAIMLPTSRAYWIAFMACVLADVISIPLFPPDDAHEGRITAILADASPDLILTDDASLEGVRAVAGRASVLVVDPHDRKELSAAQLVSACGFVAADPECVAYLQYTSGSTAKPSGAMISHGGFVANLRQIENSLRISSHQRSVTWLPMFHDMGLVFSMGVAIGFGTRVTMMSPTSFLMRPSAWLTELGAGDPTFSGAPNFAFDYTVQHLRGGLGELDLSNVQWLLNGSEPVRPDTVRGFEASLAPHGLRPGVVRPAYGLAEATVYVSNAQSLAEREVSRRSLTRGFAEAPDAPSDSQTVVSCGPIAAGLEAIVMHPGSGEELPEGRVGELWLRGPSVALGYWQDEEHTRQVFTPRLGDDEGSWLRTGDLVFLANRELYVVGRLKAMLIVDGRNHYSQDIELTVQGVDSRVRPGRVAVVGEERGGQEVAVVMAECRGVSDDTAATQLARQIEERVTRVHGVRVGSVHVLAPGFLPLTSSGKIQRSLAHERLLAVNRVP